MAAIRKNRHLGIRLSVGDIFANAGVRSLVDLAERTKRAGGGDKGEDEALISSRVAAALVAAQSDGDGDVTGAFPYNP